VTALSTIALGNTKPAALDRTRRCLPRHAYERSRLFDRQRGVALNPAQPPLLQANLTWVVDAYLISFGSFLLLAGRLGDLFGRKRVFLAGVGVFTLSSLVCSLATSQLMLIAARFMQGLGGAVSPQ